MPSPPAFVALSLDDVADAVLDAVERATKDLTDRVALLEMNNDEIRQKYFHEKPRVRVPSGRRVIT